MSPPVSMEIGNFKMITLSIEMPDYACRITHSYEVAKRVVGLWSLRCDKLIAYEHVGDKSGKVHIHLALLGTNVDKKQLRNIAASTNLPIAGNENCSFKEWDGDATYITYMSKGKLDPMYNKGYEVSDLQNLRSLWVEPHKYVRNDTTDNYLAKFDNYVFGKNIVEIGMNMNFYQLRTTVKRFVFDECHRGERPRWGQAEIAIYKMIMNTYIFQNNITIPDDEKKWKW